MTPAVDWTAQLHDQLDFHWQHSLRPRLEGLTDEEYLWEPVACLAMRTASHLGGPPADHDTWTYAGSAAGALAQLDQQYAAWSAGVAALDEEGFARPCGEAEGPFASYPLAALVLHINREMIHHGAEICLLRDLYLRATDHQESA